MNPIKPRKPISAQNALAKLEALCARSEHCTFEMRTKLKNWGVPAHDAEKIVESLVSRRFVDDVRFARAYVREKFLFSGWGRRKILMQLKLKRIPADVISNAMAATIDEDEYRAALSKLLLLRGQRMASADEQGNRQPDIATYDGRTRMYRFALQRGFESDIAAALLRQQYQQWKEKSETSHER